MQQHLYTGLDPCEKQNGTSFLANQVLEPLRLQRLNHSSSVIPVFDAALFNPWDGNISLKTKTNVDLVELANDNTISNLLADL